MHNNALHTASRGLQGVVLFMAAYYAAVYVVLAVAHLRFPFALEWIEGSVLDHVRRVYAGRQLYVPPSLEFITAIYPPLYYYCAAALAKAVGLGFLPLRLVSFAASLGSCAMLFFIVKGETGSRFCGMVTAGLFVAAYKLCGPYFDMGRIDSLFFFFFLVALYLVKLKPGARASLLAGIMLSCAILTKQTALVLALPLLFYATFFRPRRDALLCGAALAVVAGIGTLLINGANNGWYAYYVFDLPRQHPVLLQGMAAFWVRDILPALPVACACSLLYMFLPASVRPRRDLLFYLLLTACMLAVACMSRLKMGGFRNVLIPAYAALMILFGLTAGSLLRAAQGWGPRARAGAEMSISLLCIIQLAALFYNPAGLMPTERQLAAYRAAVGTIARIPGMVFAPANGYLCVMAGKQGSAHIGATNDILRADPSTVQKKLVADIRDAIREKRFTAVILDRKFPWLQNNLQGYYRLLPGYGSRHPAWPIIRYLYVPVE